MISAMVSHQLQLKDWVLIRLGYYHKKENEEETKSNKWKCKRLELNDIEAIGDPNLSSKFRWDCLLGGWLVQSTLLHILQRTCQQICPPPYVVSTCKIINAT